MAGPSTLTTAGPMPCADHDEPALLVARIALAVNRALRHHQRGPWPPDRSTNRSKAILPAQVERQSRVAACILTHQTAIVWDENAVHIVCVPLSASIREVTRQIQGSPDLAIDSLWFRRQILVSATGELSDVDPAAGN
jgi:hypothetical protein